MPNEVRRQGRSDITRGPGEGETLAERIRSRFGRSGATNAGPHECLLLDNSYSMDTDDEFNGKTRRMKLIELLEKFPGVRRFAFATQCKEFTGMLDETDGSTAMHRAFVHIRKVGITHAVLITDGEPDDEDAALAESAGLRLDIFYVGPYDPPPDFLQRLAKATGGQFGSVRFDSPDGGRVLETKVRGLLTG